MQIGVSGLLLKQMAIATHSMNDAYGYLPSAVGAYPPSSGLHGTVQFYMLPFIEQTNTYNQMVARHNDSWWCGYTIKTYISPADGTAPANGMPDTSNPRAGTSYAPNEYTFGAPGSSPTARIPATIPDGTSNTIAFSERSMICGVSSNEVVYYWGETGGWCNRYGNNPSSLGSIPAFYTTNPPQFAPLPLNCNPCMLQSASSAGIMVGLFDGSVRLVTQGITPGTWYNAVMPNDGGVLGTDW
jgi:hypothetical protein